MSTTGKLIFALVITANLAAIAAVTAMSRHSHANRDTQVIHLGKIVVTPANDPWKSPTGDAENQTIQLGAVVVTPTEADWRFAQAYGVNRPEGAAESAVVDHAQDSTAASLLQAMAALSPGQYLDSDAALRALDALVFQGAGR